MMGSELTPATAGWQQYSMLIMMAFTAVSCGIILAVSKWLDR